ncbi:MAG: cobalt ECF transporter T component CbiQ [Deltaproteobacteria bacterium]|nr:cobalt ECF transporter T component CbiQ [Deltaproteobacteria bacterium]
MDHTLNIIYVPGWIAASLVLMLAALPLGIYLVVSRNKAAKKQNNDKPDWSVPSIDAYASQISFFHTWDPRVKIIVIFSCCFLIVSLDNMIACLVALIIACLSVHFCKIPWQRARNRLLAMTGFLSMFLIVIPFSSPTRPGETILLFPLLSAFPFHVQGLYVALVIILKACSVALLMEPMFGTASLSVTLQALRRLGLPSVITQMILLTHRYIFVFLQEVVRMYRGMKVRGFTPRTDIPTMRTMGNFLGMLFIRSFERTQRVHEAMLSRGYHGLMPTYIQFELSAKDIAKASLWLIIAIVLMIVDLFAPVLSP